MPSPRISFRMVHLLDFAPGSLWNPTLKQDIDWIVKHIKPDSSKENFTNMTRKDPKKLILEQHNCESSMFEDCSLRGSFCELLQFFTTMLQEWFWAVLRFLWDSNIEVPGLSPIPEIPTEWQNDRMHTVCILFISVHSVLVRASLLVSTCFNYMHIVTLGISWYHVHNMSHGQNGWRLL